MSITLASLAVQFLERQGPSQKTIRSYESTLMPLLQQHGRSPFHLRNTFSTERVGLMGIEGLSPLMGHENIQTTLRYQKVASNRAEEVANKALEILANTEIN
jgi:integrase/recombinase XerD